MPAKQRSRGGNPVHADLAEAVLDSGFALLRLAESETRCGARREARRAIQEAEAACSEGRCRLSGVETGDARRLASGFEELSAAVAVTKARLRSAAPPGNGRILQMPPRK